VLGSIAYVPNDRQPKECAWDSLFTDLPPVRPSGVLEGTQFRLGESTISRSGDRCSEGSWVFYNTRSVRSTVVSILDSRSPANSFRLNPLQTLHVSTRSSRAKMIQRHHLSFSRSGTSLLRETATTKCPCYTGGTAITRTPTSLYRQRFVSLASGFLKLTSSESGYLLYFQRATPLHGWRMPTRRSQRSPRS
jgi:hypothetical protein